MKVKLILVLTGVAFMSDKKLLDVPGIDHGRPRGLYNDAKRRCEESW
ncbi:MAG: hypothetical protein IKE55_05155 [Kiritimatiellae bacterium]|nr:hypothetical protein [Kiritimatiellia bacterium]